MAKNVTPGPLQKIEATDSIVNRFKTENPNNYSKEKEENYQRQISHNSFRGSLVDPVSADTVMANLVSGPAQIQTPELDSAVGNNATEKPAESLKLTTRGTANYIGRQAVGGALSGTAEAANYFTNAAVMAEPIESMTNTERLRWDAGKQEDIDRVYKEYLAGLSRDERDAMEITGTLPSREEVYAQRMMPEAQSAVDKVDLSRRYNWDQSYLQETQNRYENVEIGKGVQLAGDVARTVGQMAPAMALNFVPGAGQVLSSAYLFSSAAGAAMNEALANGATNRQAMDYGDAVGLVELATEKMFDGLGGLLGKGAADDVVEGIISKAYDSGLLKSAAGMNILRLSLGALGEGAEEVVSDLVNPLITRATLGKDKKLNWSEVGYDALLGVLTGGLLGNIGLINGQYRALNDSITSATAAEVLNDFAETELGQQVVQNAEAIQDSPVGENTTQTQAPADDRLFHEPVNRSTANKILFDPEQRAAFEAETGVSLSNMSIRDAANLIMEYSRQSAETGQTGFDVAYPIKTPQAPKQFDHALTRSEAMRVANDPTLRALFEQETGRTIPGKKYAVQFIQNVTAQLAEQANAPAQPTSPIAQTVMQNEAQQAQAPAPQEQAPAQQPAPAPAQNRVTPAKPARQSGQVRSQSEANTIQAMDERLNAPEQSRQALYYTPQSEAQSVSQARSLLENGYEPGNQPGRTSSKLTPEQRGILADAGSRLGAGYAQAIADMQGAPAWTTVQQDMSTLMLEALAEDAAARNDWSAYEAWRIIDQEHGAEIGRTLQARGKRTRSYTDFIDDVSDYINGLDLSQEAKDQVKSTVLPFAQEYMEIQRAADNGADPETVKANLIGLIEQVSDARHTGTFFKGNLHKLLEKQNAEYLSSIARAQFKSVAYDYVPVSIGAKVKTWQTIAQLLKITTAMRNLGGNATFGLMDAMVGDTFGQVIDSMVGAKTGARSVAVNNSFLSSTWRQAAADAMYKSALEVALDVDLNAVGDNVTDPSKIDPLSIGNKYNPGGRSNKMNGNAGERFLSRLEQLLSYSLVTSDKLFRGGIEAETTEGLNRLNAGNEAALNQSSDVARNTANYQLFQNKSRAAQATRAVHDFLNLAGFGGKVNGAQRTGGFGVGDFLMPYATVPANLGVKPFEFSPLGIIKGGIDLAKVLKDANNGNVNLAAQNQAVMEISRGITGVPVAMLFAQLIRNGIIKRSDDDDDYDVTKARQSENRRETQWNLDATIRHLSGGSPEWQEGDKLISLNWLEPLNAFMDIGALFADIQGEEDPALAEYSKQYAFGALNAFLEMPLMDSLQTTVNAVRNLESGNAGDKLAQAAESTFTSGASGLVPGIISQISKTIDPVTRDTSGDTFMERFTNAVQNATPWRDRLPEKLDSFGQPITNDNQFLNALNNLFLPGQVAEYAPNDVVQALDQVYQDTGKSTFYPDYKAPNKFDYGGADYELNTEEKRLYQETFGQTYNDLVQSVIDSDDYSKLTADEKATLFSEMRSMAAAEAKGEIVTGRGGEYSSDYDKVSELSDIPGYFAAKAMLKTAAGDENNRDYERIPEILESYGALPDDVKAKLKDSNATGYMDELYDAWKGGVEPENWYKAYDAKSDLEPYGDNKSVSDWQKYQAMADAVSSEDADIIFRGYMEDTAYDKYMNARNAGVSAQDWANAMAEAGKLEPYGTHKSVSDWQKYQAMASTLSDKDMDAMMKAYLDKGPYEKYLSVRDDGISAKQWADAWAEAGKVEPLPGKETVADWQKYDAIASSVDPNTADAIFKAELGEGQYARYTFARDAGITPEQWADTRAGVAQLPVLEGNKEVSNWQKVNYIGSSSDLTNEQKDALMILYFDKGEGNKVSTYDKYMYCRSAGFAPQHIAKFYEIYSTTQGVDKNNDGKTDSGSKKANIIAAAMSYGFTKDNAEKLYSMWQNGKW